eukprot:Filipodium_phascolosomae@DN8484_c0_g1_i1.p1
MPLCRWSVPKATTSRTTTTTTTSTTTNTTTSTTSTSSTYPPPPLPSVLLEIEAARHRVVAAAPLQLDFAEIAAILATKKQFKHSGGGNSGGGNSGGRDGGGANSFIATANTDRPGSSNSSSSSSSSHIS